jgi:hypothetical protein
MEQFLTDDDSVTFQGCANPPGRPDGSDTLYMTKSDLEVQVKKLSGAPLQSEHDSNIKIGKINKAWINEKGELEVEGTISRKTKDGCQAIVQIRNGSKPALSIGSNYLLDTNTWKIVGKDIHEISVVKNPDQEGTIIKNISDDSETFKMAKEQCRLTAEITKTRHDIKNTKRELKDIIAEKRRENPNYGISVPQPKKIEKMSESNGQASNPPKAESTDAEAVKKALAETKELLAKLEAEKKQVDAENARYKALKRSPEELEAEAARKHAKKLKQYEEEKQVALDFVTKILKDTGNFKEDHPVIDTIKNKGKDYPEEILPLVSFCAKAHAFHETSISEREKQYQESRKEVEEQAKRAKEMEEKMEVMKKDKAAWEKISGQGGLKPLPQHTQAPPAPTQTRETKRESNSHETALLPPPQSKPDLSNIFIGGVAKKVIPVPSGRGLQASDEHKSLLDIFKENTAKRTGMDKATHLREGGYKLPKDGAKSVGNSYFELTF